MIPIKTFRCESKPTQQEILEAIKIAKEDKCIVELKWFVAYSGNYSITISAEETFEGIVNKLPKKYPV